MHTMFNQTAHHTNAIGLTQKNLLIALLILLVTFILSGCANGGSPGQVARDWSCKIREMQVRPLFPPREDMHVGDIYWLQTIADKDSQGYCTNQKEFLSIPIHVAYSAEANKSASQYYKSRPDFPSISNGTSSISITTSGMVISGGSQSSLPTNSVNDLFSTSSQAANRLRLVAFPDFMSVKVERTSLGAILPIQGVFASLGLSIEDVESASISIPVAESYGIPAALAISSFNNATSTVTIQALCAWQKSVSKETGQLHLIREVFYTRAIDVNIQSSKASALGLSRDRQDSVATTVSPVTFTSTTTAGTSTKMSFTGMTQQQMTDVAASALKLLTLRNSVPGVSLSLESGQSSAISMRRVFDRPVAIGYRSVLIPYKIDGNKCILNWEDFLISQNGDSTPTPAKDKEKQE
jgi:type 1 fimbria pilin